MKREIIYSVRGPKNLPEMTWEEVAEAREATDLAIFPVGSTEEHGPQNPLLADTIQGIEVSRRVVARLDDEGIRAIAGPPVPFGVSLELMDFPGTITLTPSTMQALLKDVCNSLIRHGFRKLVLLMSHAENLGAVYSVVQEVSQQPDVRILALNWLPLLRRHNPEILKGREMGHGGEGETARVLAAHPGLVVMERARAFQPEWNEGPEADYPMHIGGGVFDPPRGMKDLTPIGCLGNPTLATAETGEKCYDLIVDWTCQVIKKHLQLT
ncbi:MAG: creatininase family protein [Chloroflexi bacterium]|nr:creatininase family protein [Chloroflexota bacterium]